MVPQCGMNSSHRPPLRQSPARAFGLFLGAVLAALLAGCGPSAPPAAAVPDKSITVTANDDMKYDTAKIDAKPGQKLRITLQNTGTAPKFSMGHNLTVLNKGTNVNKFIEAGAEHAAESYIDPAMKGNIIATTKLLGPGESDTITFKAPMVPADYDFVCTFPGHAAVGMKGKLVVAP